MGSSSVPHAFHDSPFGYLTPQRAVLSHEAEEKRIVVARWARRTSSLTNPVHPEWESISGNGTIVFDRRRLLKGLCCLV